MPAAGAEQHPGGGQCRQHAAGRLHQHEHQKGHRPRVDIDAGETQIQGRLGGCQVNAGFISQQDWCGWQVCSDRLDQSSVSCIDTFDSVPLGIPKHFSQHRPWVNWIDPVSELDSPLERLSVTWIHQWKDPVSGFTIG